MTDSLSQATVPTDLILDQIHDGVLLVTPGGELTYKNRAASTLMESVIFSDHCFGFSLREAFRTKEAPKKLSLSLTDKELLIRPIFLENYLLIFIQDITDSKKFERLYARQERMRQLGDMIATVAHEIRNPLGGIRGFATLLHRDLKTYPQLQEMAQHIIEGADHLNLFVTQILNYARPVQPHFQQVNLNQVIEELAAHVIADARLNSRIKFRYEHAPEPLMASIDASLLQSALLNLIVNAIQAMPEGGDLLLSVEKQREKALIKVQDTGEGIPEKNMPKLFSPFFTTRANGNGLGLAEVKKIVRAHSGTLSVTSQEHVGTTFTLKLPLENI